MARYDRHSRLSLVLLAGLTVMGGASCSADRMDGPPRITVRDSAGVVIVEQDIPSDGPTWTVSAEPDVRIGVVDGAPEYQLHEVTDVAQLPDGTILVADEGTHELRFFSKEGLHERSVGRLGEGPGEFRSVTLIEVTTDSIYVYDDTQRRVSAFDHEGSFGSVHALNTPSNLFMGTGRLSNGTWIMGGLSVPGGPREGRARDDRVWTRVAPEGGVVDTILRGHSAERVMGFRVISGRRSPLPTPVLFSVPSQVVVYASGMWYADGRRFELEYRAGDGALLRLVRVTRPPVLVTEDDVRKILLEMPAPRPGAPAYVSAETMPAHGQVLVDATGRAWVADYLPFAELETVTWNVFDAEGHWIARAATPRALTVLFIGEANILGLRRDDLGVNYVVSHHVTSSP